VHGIFIAGLGRAGRGLLGLARQHDLPILGSWRGRSQSDLPELPTEACTLLLAVPDPVVAPLTVALWEARRLVEGSVVLHLAARLNGAEARPDADAPMHFGGFHPLQAFPAEGPVLPGFFVGIGGEDEACATARELADALVLPWFSLNDEARPAYHAAAVLCSNLLVGLQAVAQASMARALDMPDEEAAALLEPLAMGTLSNLAGNSPVQALTGPIARGDADAVLLHLDVLEESARRAYASLSLALLDSTAERFAPAQLRRLRARLESTCLEGIDRRPPARELAE